MASIEHTELAYEKLFCCAFVQQQTPRDSIGETQNQHRKHKKLYMKLRELAQDTHRQDGGPSNNPQHFYQPCLSLYRPSLPPVTRCAHEIVVRARSRTGLTGKKQLSMPLNILDQTQAESAVSWPTKAAKVKVVKTKKGSRHKIHMPPTVTVVYFFPSKPLFDFIMIARQH